MDTSLVYLIEKFLDSNKYLLNPEEVKLQLLSHPSFPSLHSITGLLDHFGIENLALEVSKDLATLKELPEVFITTTVHGEYVLANNHEDRIRILYGNENRKNISIAEFLTLWSGFIIVVEPNEIKEETNRKTYYNTNLPYYLLAIVATGIFFGHKVILFNSLHFTLSLAGIIISGFILKHEFGFKSKLVDKLCSSNETTNCDAVLNSDAAQIHKNIKLSDLCLVYFSSIGLYWVLSQLNTTSQTVIIIPTLLAIPVTFYSIYYQYRVIKKWCPLCLGIIGVLWLQFFSLFTISRAPSFNFDSGDILVFFLSFLLIVSFWSYTRPFLNSSIELDKLRITHYKFIRNFELFIAAFTKSTVLETQITPIQDAEIVLGNKDAPLRLLLITNPQCYYCKEAHADLERILDGHSQKVSVTIRFSVNTEQPSLALKIAQRLLELYSGSKNELFNNGLHEVYMKNANLDQWIQKWGEAKPGPQIETLTQQRDWCIQNKINFTPALFVNGREFPKEYQREHLSFFIEDLIDFIEIENAQLNQIPHEIEK